MFTVFKSFVYFSNVYFNVSKRFKDDDKLLNQIGSTTVAATEGVSRRCLIERSVEILKFFVTD